MLRDYVDLEAGDWVLQNGANSGVRPHTLTKLLYYAHEVLPRSVKVLYNLPSTVT